MQQYSMLGLSPKRKLLAIIAVGLLTVRSRITVQQNCHHLHADSTQPFIFHYSPKFHSSITHLQDVLQ